MPQNKIALNNGERYGILNVINFSGVKNGHKMYLCLCDCGNHINVRGSSIKSGNTVGCGCLKSDTWKTNLKSNATHKETVGKKVSVEYECYHKIKGRCYNKNNNKYPLYGGRGIVMCDRWKTSFDNFLIDMGRRPADCNSIERINVNENYSPDNCVWANSKTQSRNKTTTVRLNIYGVLFCQKDLAKMLGITSGAVKYHLRKGKTGTEIYSYFKSKNN